MARTKLVKPIFTAAEMSNELWDVMKKVKSRKIRPNEANAIVSQARAITSLAKLQLDAAKFTGQKDKVIGLVRGLIN